jgi:low density lipoprotein-related protein 2
VVDGLGQKIDVFDLEGVYHSIVLSSNLTSPVDIALDPTVGFMFITDNNRVLRSRMDGTFLTAIVTDAVYKASGISVDLPTRRVYWCQSYKTFFFFYSRSWANVIKLFMSVIYEYL